MSSLHTRNETGSTGGAGGELPPSALPAVPSIQDEDDDAYERRLKLTDVIGFVALNGYALEADACAGLNRETWRCNPAGLSAADADRVCRDHPLWQAIINLKHGKHFETRLGWASRHGQLARVRELCDWSADIEATDCYNNTPLHYASNQGHNDVVRELLFRGADANAADCGWTPLILSSLKGHVEVVRVLLAAGADKHHVNRHGHTATSIAGYGGNQGSRAAILGLLAAAP
jgi:hypothetical protein